MVDLLKTVVKYSSLGIINFTNQGVVIKDPISGSYDNIKNVIGIVNELGHDSGV